MLGLPAMSRVDRFSFEPFCAALQKKIEETVADALDQAPWTQEQKK
jgi:hypothetical protein